MSEFDRTSKEYLDFALAQAFKHDPDVVIDGITTEVIPQPFEDLEAEVVSLRTPWCGGSEDVNLFLESIRHLPNRDHVVQLLPANGENIALVIPHVN